MSPQLETLRESITELSSARGFQATGFSDVQLHKHEEHLQRWLDNGYHGEMEYMQRHGSKRSRPQELLPGTVSVISVRMDYWPANAVDAQALLERPAHAYVSRYAVGRDYHKLMRKRLQQLADDITEKYGAFGYRVFVDSAPVLEKALAEKAGLGWIGKHSNLLQEKTGSWFFIGEILTDLPLIDQPPTDKQSSSNQVLKIAAGNNLNTSHCGSCTACLDACPTDAIVAPYKVDARRCISYLTIELRTSIPIEFRKAMGNRIYGCDDCQLVCPFNKFSKPTCEADFEPRHALDNSKLVDLFGWNREEFLHRTEGSPIRRIGYECWLRNIAVALGNGPSNDDAIDALRARANDESSLVREHTQWALAQHGLDESGQHLSLNS